MTTFRSFSAFIAASFLTTAGCTTEPPAHEQIHAAVQSSEPEVVEVAKIASALDTAPSADGSTFYVLGDDGRGPGVFRLPASGKRHPLHDVRIGAPFVTPLMLAAGIGDNQLFVADPAAGGAGRLFVIGAHNGKVLGELAAGTRPQGVEVTGRKKTEQVYFTGFDPNSGRPGVFRVSPGGGAPVAVLTGAPLSDPSGVAITSGGDVYVSDTPGVRGAGRVIRVRNGAASEIATGLWLGSPAGVALSVDEKLLLVSGLNDPAAGAQVYVIDLATHEITLFDKGIKQNDGAGGVHRAARKDVFGWAGIRGAGGLIYRISLGAAAY